VSNHALSILYSNPNYYFQPFRFLLSLHMVHMENKPELFRVLRRVLATTRYFAFSLPGTAILLIQTILRTNIWPISSSSRQLISTVVGTLLLLLEGLVVA
jgi:hypothetical protein